jgi:hypothetical protein
MRYNTTMSTMQQWVPCNNEYNVQCQQWIQYDHGDNIHDEYNETMNTIIMSTMRTMWQWVQYTMSTMQQWIQWTWVQC